MVHRLVYRLEKLAHAKIGLKMEVFDVQWLYVHVHCTIFIPLLILKFIIAKNCKLCNITHETVLPIYKAWLTGS